MPKSNGETEPLVIGTLVLMDGLDVAAGKPPAVAAVDVERGVDGVDGGSTPGV